MSTEIENISIAIAEKVSAIDQDLKEIDSKGIFFAPELHISFECGKEIMLNKKKIFGQKSFEWMRERKFDNYGYADLAFESNSTKYIIEFKIMQTINQRKLVQNVEQNKKNGGCFKLILYLIIGIIIISVISYLINPKTDKNIQQTELNETKEEAITPVTKTSDWTGTYPTGAEVISVPT